MSRYPGSLNLLDSACSSLPFLRSSVLCEWLEIGGNLSVLCKRTVAVCRYLQVLAHSSSFPTHSPSFTAPLSPTCAAFSAVDAVLCVRGNAPAFPNDMSGPENLSISSPTGLLLVVVVFACFLVFEKGSHRTQTGFELTMSENDFEHQTFLPVSPKAWGYRHAHLHPASVLLGT